MRKYYYCLGYIMLSVMIYLGCQEEKLSPTKIVLASEKIVVGVGNTEPIYASPFPDSKNKYKIDWSSDDNGIAKVDQNGMVTGVSPGSTYVNVIAGSLSTSVLIEVYEPLTDISISPSVLNVNLKILFGAAESYQVTASPIPTSASETMLWSSSNNNIATVSQVGLITAVDDGTALITIEGSGKTVKKEITVTVTKTGDDPVKFDSKLFKRQILPDDKFLDRSSSWALEKIWDGNRSSAGGSSCALDGPQSFTFDMGVSGSLAYLHLFTWKSLGEGYPPFSEANLKKFEVWGSEALDMNSASDNWKKLMDCEVIKPSGLPLMQYNADDVKASDAGQKFYNQQNYDIKVRYIRIKVIETWEGVPCWRISEIELYGKPD